LVDTGAFYNCIDVEFVRRLNLRVQPLSNSYPTTLLSASGNSVQLLGKLTTNVYIAGYPFEIEFVVVDGLTHNIILGLSMLQQHKAVVDLANNSLSLADGMVIVPLIQRFSKVNIVRNIHAITIPPMHETEFPVKLSQKYHLQPSLIEPLPSCKHTGLLVAKVLVEPDSHTTLVRVANVGDKPITLRARRCIAAIVPAELISCQNTTVDDDMHVCTLQNDSVPYDEQLKVLKQMGFKLENEHLTPDHFRELVTVLYKNKRVFATDITDLPGVNEFSYDIHLEPGTRPTRPRQYRYPPHLRKVIDEQLESWQKAGIIQEGSPSWIYPIVVVRKKIN